MFYEIFRQLKTAFILLIIFTVLTGFIYPMLVTGLAQVLFPYEANGSLIIREGKYIGSELIGQNFTEPGYFWGRPSATTPFPYNAQQSGGSNLAPSNPDLISEVTKNFSTLRKADSENHQLIPVDLITSSASGLDPEISPLAAYYQISRIAAARGMAEQDLQNFVIQFIKNRTFAILGESRVNVLEMNIALDSLQRVPLEEFFKNNEKGQ